MRRLVFCLVLVAGCLSPEGAPVTERSGAIGEPTNGFPSALERLGLMAINRARSDPATVKGPQSTIYPARPPVIWSLALNQSARFHTTTLELGDVTLMHSSPCTLNTDVATSGCSGDPACACATAIPSSCAMCAQVAAENTCGTAWNTRVGYFTAGAGISITGEVAAAGYKDPMATVDGWMDEAAGSDGHRTNLTDQGITSNTMGYGHATGTKECYSPFDVSDSGSIKGATIPKMPTAAVTPPSGNAGTFTFYATWADPSLGTPGSINVVLDGACTAMTLELGTDTLNATYKATATLAAGCHTYWILARDASGGRVTYPTTGAYDIPVGGGTTCSGDYVATAPAGSCDSAGGGGTTGSGGAPATGGATGTGGTTSVGTGGTAVTGTGGSTTGTGGGSSGGTTGTGGASSGGTTGTGGATGTGGLTPTDKPASGGCSCEVATPDLPSSAAGFLLLALLSLVRRAPEPRRLRRR
ncbi:MAG TPA: hypothetical protein VI456_04530 [Polyangia bacterium]